MRFSSFNTLLDLLSSNAFLEKLSIPQISVSFFEICNVGTLVMIIHKEIYPHLAIHQLWIANSLTSFYILATCLNQCVETWQVFRFFLKKQGIFDKILFFWKNIRHQKMLPQIWKFTNSDPSSLFFSPHLEFSTHSEFLAPPPIIW